ncbi:hypothetical protein [Reyranella sp.]|uniref:hypothetical protein n=1 Tax=Reyranella sp. TaxID=1929291 RepID=UPI003D113A33
MHLTLAWMIAHVPAILAALFVSVRDGLKLPNFAQFGWDTLINYADRLFWISVTSSGFVVFDFVRRATSWKIGTPCWVLPLPGTSPCARFLCCWPRSRLGWC